MKLTVLANLFLIVLLGACSDDKITITCFNESVDPEQDLPWLQQQINNIENLDPYWKQYLYISTTEVKGNTIFIFPNCCPTCNSVWLVYDCEGNLLGSIGDDTYGHDLLDNDTIVWKDDALVCN